MNGMRAACALCITTLLLLAALPVRAALSEADLAKIAQNPVGNLISVPFQENLYLNTGAADRTLSVLNIQPVIPVSVNGDWNVITRTVVPVISQPGFYPNQGTTRGIGDVQFSAFLSPANPGGWIWGAGPVMQLPTHSDSALGNGNAGLGPTIVLLHLQKGDPWVYGMLANNIWSLGGSSSEPAYNNGLVQPFLNYNLPNGLYYTSAPVWTANWKAGGSERWTLPLGGGIGKIFHFGRLPVNAQISAYYNVVSPQYGANWQLRSQVQLMFPK